MAHQNWKILFIQLWREPGRSLPYGPGYQDQWKDWTGDPSCGRRLYQPGQIRL